MKEYRDERVRAGLAAGSAPRAQGTNEKKKTLLQAVCLKHKVQILAFLKKCIAGLGVVKLPGH